ncbi:metallophosphoesterase family protein [Allokutzneria albata]|uniref:Calcineurin-like phosphoesterase n=1 Tax=Allokutzneria albata TaxID=211114 RepID=A0A1G9VZ27_ALLAB|nr:metallophosphoesterase [Allokutzneria albata]SDM77201.1 Calcineurin-like phosphoesterase [Allokutzneria albata]
MNPSRVLPVLLALTLVGASASPARTAESAPAETVIAVAGDIADTCLASSSSCVHPKTAKLVTDMNPVAVLTAGDNQYQSGTIAQYRKYYDTTWGKFKAITKPSPGNHEYNDKARGYKEYFGAVATPQGKTYYSHDIGNWHFVALDSNLPTGETSEQGRWLVDDLKRTTKGCIAAYWHHPFVSGASHGDQKVAEPLWRMLYAAGADVVFVGHDHSYERFKPLNPSRQVDEAKGIRSVVIGSGGASLYPVKPRPSTEKAYSKHGVMKLRITDTTYAWDHLGLDGKVLDSAGPYTCH